MDDSDDILYRAATELLATSVADPPIEAEEAVIVQRVIMVVEFVDDQGEPKVRIRATESSEWWQTAGLLRAADLLLVPNGSQLDEVADET